MLVQALGLTPLSGAAVAVLTVLALFTLAPQVDVLVDKTRLWPAGLALIVTMVSLGVGAATLGFSDARPRALNVVYALDADKHEAYWVARATATHPWLRQFFGDAPLAGRPAVLTIEYRVSGDSLMASSAPSGNNTSWCSGASRCLK